MIHAYDKQYVNDARNCLGEAMEYSVYRCGVTMDQFLKLFIGSGYARAFGVGVPGVVAGTSGTELVWKVFGKSGIAIKESPGIQEYDYPAEYWCGWILAYYQWYTGRGFEDIQKYIIMKDIEELYPTLHEAPEEKFVEVVNRRIQKVNPASRLQQLRRLKGYSQRMLAMEAGVNLRTLQQYELRAKDINKAAGTTLLALSRTLGCRMEDLLEYDTRRIKDTGEDV